MDATRSRPGSTDMCIESYSRKTWRDHFGRRRSKWGSFNAGLLAVRREDVNRLCWMLYWNRVFCKRRAVGLWRRFCAPCFS